MLTIMPLILLLPLLIAIAVISFIRNPNKIRYVSLIGSLASLVLIPFISYGVTTTPWFSIGTYTFNITTMITPISLLLLAIVLLIAPLIIMYSIGYMGAPSEQKRFYVELLAFEAAMLAFAMSGNFITLFISWEFLSITSYLLIGFWHYTDKPVKAARKAVTIILIGDVALLAAIAIFWQAFNTLEFVTIFSSLSIGTMPNSVYIAALLLLTAIFTKSAQFPFQEWLPDAMEGPTPVSAFLHSSTMVKAGVFATLIFLPLFSLTNLTAKVLLPISIATIALSTLNAAKEMHIKRVLAYSTVQELGLMIFAISIGAVFPALYFFLAQSFYKALLFFSSGVTIKATDTEELDKTSGLKMNKFVYITTIFGVLSLAGFIPFDGFFAGVSLGSFLLSNLAVYIVISAVSLLTSFYIFRWLLLISRKPSEKSVEINYITQPKSMTISMIIMTVPLLAASAVFFLLPNFLGSSTNYYLDQFLQSSTSTAIPITETVIDSAIIVAGAVISYFAYKKRKAIRSEALSLIAYNSRIMNGFYTYIAMIAYQFSEGAGVLDTYLNRFFDYMGITTGKKSLTVRKISVGDINVYAFLLVVGTLAIFVYLYLFGLVI